MKIQGMRESTWELERSGLRGGGGGRRVLVWCVEKGETRNVIKGGGGREERKRDSERER